MDAATAISAFASVISAVGGAAAAVAAFRSAGSARAALGAAQEAEHRASLREVSATAAALSVEAERVESCVQGLMIEYRDAEIFSGSRDHSGFKELRGRVTAKASRVSELGGGAALFLGGASSLKKAPPDEIDRVQIRLSEALVTVRGIREDLQSENVRVSTDNAAQRERALRGKNFG